MNDKYRYITKIYRNMQVAKSKNKDELTDNEREMLRYISKHRDVKNIDLVSKLGVDKALVSRIVTKFIKLGFISVIEGEDKRTKLINITEVGTQLKLSWQSFESKYYRDILADISDDDLNTFFKVLEKAYLKSKQKRKENETL